MILFGYQLTEVDMEQMHTAEPWGAEGLLKSDIPKDFFPHLFGCEDKEGYFPFGATHCKEDARRIVACVNALAGVSTEELEQSGFIGGLLEQVECSSITEKNMEGRLNIATIKSATIKAERDFAFDAIQHLIDEAKLTSAQYELCRQAIASREGVAR
jgi:hypothetical protein